MWSICCVRTPVVCSSLYVINRFVVEMLSEISIWNCNCIESIIICRVSVNMHIEICFTKQLYILMRSFFVICKYRIFRKSLRDIRPLMFSSRDGHAEGEHVNRGRDTASFCCALQVLDMSTVGDF
jgi:hypothetical protein